MNVFGQTAAGDPLELRLEELIGTHLLAIANSGGGKSGLLRRLLEISHGRVLQFVLDPEDELYTLREKYDFVIVGGDGADAPATVAGAASLARAALEHGFSVIARLNDLGADAPAFVARFIHALIGAPQSLWRPAIIAIDELQRFAPREGSTDASGEILDLVNRGRKRDLTLVGASLRMTSIDPAVRAMVNNWLLGRVGQTLDRNTMAEQLGFTRGEARELLRGLAPRHFWALGPAIANEPVLFRVDDVETTPVRRGEAKPATPPAPEAMREILAGIAAAAPAAELPDDTIPADPLEAAAKGALVGGMIVERDREIARLDARVVDLQAEMAILGAELDELRGVDRECDRYASGHTLLNEILYRLQEGIPLPTKSQFLAAFGDIHSSEANMHSHSADLHESTPALPRSTPAPVVADAPPDGNPAEPGLPVARAAGGASKARKPESQKSGPVRLSKTAIDAAELLKAIAPDGIAWNELLMMIGRRPNSGDSRAARKALIERDLMRAYDSLCFATGVLTSDDEIAIGLWPGPDELLEVWSQKLRGPGGQILLDLAANGPASAKEVAERLNRSPTSGWWRTGLKDLRSSNLVRDIAGKLELHEALQECGEDDAGGRNRA